MCTLIFSTAESPPVSVYGKYNVHLLSCNVRVSYVLVSLCTDQFSLEYVTFLLDTIESSATDSSMEDIADGFLNLLLSFNQHFTGKQQPMDVIYIVRIMIQSPY